MIVIVANGLIRMCSFRFISITKCGISKRSVSIKSFKRQQNHSHSVDFVNDPPQPSDLIKPFLFTVAFSTASLSFAKYRENRNYRKGRAGDRTTDSYSKDSQSTKDPYHDETYANAFLPIFVINIMVFMSWRLRPLQPILVKYFLANPAAPNNCWPMLFSSFSHIHFLHLSFNMYALYVFTPITVSYMGPEQYTGFYYAAAVISTFASYVMDVLMKRSSQSLGASGAVLAVFGYACTVSPDTDLSFIFIPFVWVKAGSLLYVTIATDIIGLFTSRSIINHAAHLGGSLFGIFWALIGGPEDHRYDVSRKNK